MRRIVILGCPGSGKSTLARELGSILALEVFHPGVHYLEPGGSLRTEAERDAILQREVLARDSWIFEGTERRTLDLRLRAADTAVFLDFPTALCLWRVVLRGTVRRNRPAPDLAPGCKPYLNRQVLGWVLSFRRDYRPDILAALSRHGRGLRIVVLRRPSEVRRFLAGLRDAPGLRAASPARSGV